MRPAVDRDDLAVGVGRHLAVLGDEDPPAAVGRVAGRRDVAAERHEDAAPGRSAARARPWPRRSAASALPVEPRSSSTPGRSRTSPRTRRQLDGLPAGDGLEAQLDRARPRAERREVGVVADRPHRPPDGRVDGPPGLLGGAQGDVDRLGEERADRDDPPGRALQGQSSLSGRKRLYVRSTRSRRASTAARAVARSPSWTTRRTPVPSARQEALSMGGASTERDHEPPVVAWAEPRLCGGHRRGRGLRVEVAAERSRRRRRGRRGCRHRPRSSMCRRSIRTPRRQRSS